ncbi:unnamed protein product [Dovyalis caffra]|uniref:Uncharacterized protein n=1 Tax=Dovyalis caffra TaxID=77055 RepID=A0AAV1RGI8_9ROSI|nr:unnamed protein product [Dovyalis caffra]
MEAKHKGTNHGFVRGKLVKSLFGMTKPSKLSKPLQSSSSPYTPNGSPVDSPTRQSYCPNPPSIQKVSTTKLRSFPDSGGDENVDMKAATYISFGNEAHLFYSVSPTDMQAVGKKALEWNLNDLEMGWSCERKERIGKKRRVLVIDDDNLNDQETGGLSLKLGGERVTGN